MMEDFPSGHRAKLFVASEFGVLRVVAYCRMLARANLKILCPLCCSGALYRTCATSLRVKEAYLYEEARFAPAFFAEDCS